MVFQLNKDRGIRGIFNPNMPLSNYNLHSLDIIAVEILTHIGRETIRNFYMTNPNFLDNHPEALLKSLTYISDNLELKEGEDKKKKKKQRPVNYQA